MGAFDLYPPRLAPASCVIVKKKKKRELDCLGIQGVLLYFARVAVNKVPRTGSVNSRSVFLVVLEAGSPLGPRSRQSGFW